MPQGSATARRILLRGRVQGVGFRPFVHRLASRLGLSGWVRNLSGQVIIYIEGRGDRLDEFQAALLSDAPPLARPELTEVSSVVATGIEGFFIEESVGSGVRSGFEAGTSSDSTADSALDSTPDSRSSAGSGTYVPPDVTVPPDMAMCDDCRRELWDTKDRRHHYPFLNCTQCGPRYTIIASLPYDRARTSMDRFPLCPECGREYRDITDRRYHAEPIACPTCGPGLELAAGSPPDQSHDSSTHPLHGSPTHPSPPFVSVGSPLEDAVQLLRDGGILAMKGVGGYHLLCDASSESAVSTLRARKARPGKPLAVLVPRTGEDGLDVAREVAHVSPAAAEALLSPAHPIVLVPRRDGARASARHSGETHAEQSHAEPSHEEQSHERSPEPRLISDAVAPGLTDLGLLLPYSPLHELVARMFGGPLVATSGNSSGEPLVFTRADAVSYLDGLADAYLHNDRPILRPIDDSVYRDLGDVVVPIRLGRGVAPLELPLPRASKRARLAVGGHMKNSVALGWGDRAILSGHLGDLERPRAIDAFVQTAESLQVLYRVAPEEVVADTHPDYASTRWAREFVQARPGRSLLTVPHHRAHASALAAEHSDVKRWLVLTWDGVGLGEDGTLWGGEAFHGAPGKWRRVGSFRPFRILGAGRAGREPKRSADGLFWESGWESVLKTDPIAHAAWKRNLGCAETTAVGRLFDAAAAVLTGRTHYDFEAQGPMELEALADACPQEAVPIGSSRGLRLPLHKDDEGLLRVNWRPFISLFRSASTLDPRIAAAGFHAALADAAVRLALRVYEETPFDALGLSGGVFQNRRLTREVWSRCASSGLDVRIARQVPMNDGGLAYGQLVEAVATEG
ncbi:MAG: carbamoyltransferase HypF [Candidatus Eisenbacteria bacterium]|nr:carbamoyltransferase HypF [Candidatus Eisenbacteria bacterium]